MSLFHAYNQTVADGTATSVVRPSDWNSAHNQQITLAGNTAGQSTISGTNIAFQGGNNVTLSAITAAGAATILVSGANTVAQSVQPAYYAASGSTSSANTLDFGNSNGVSFSLSNGSVVATVATNYMASNQSSNFVNTSQSSLFQQTSATSAITSAAFPTANSTNLVNTSQSSLFQQTSATSAITSAAFPSANTTKFAGTGFTSTTTAGTAVTAALGTNGLTMAVPAFITTYVNDLTSGRAGTGFTSTTTAGTAITAALGTNGLSMAVPNYLTTYVNDLTSGRAGTGFTSTTTAGTAITAALGTNGLSMAVPAYLTTYVNDLTSGRAGTGFTSASTAGAAITAALGTNGLSMAVPNYLTTYVGQTTQTQAAGSIAGIGYTSTTQAGTTVGVTQGTAGLSVAWPPFITTAAGGTGGYPVAFSASGGSSSFSTLTFSNLVNNVTFSNSAGQVVMSHSLAGQGTTLNLTNLNGTLDVGSNGVALSLNNVDAHYAAWELEGANTAGTTATTLTTSGVFYLSGGNNITLSGNSNTIVIQGGAGGGGTTASFMEPNMLVGTSLSSLGLNSLYFLPVKPAFDVSMTAVNMLVSLAYTSFNDGRSVAHTINYGWYSLGTGASTSQIGLMQSSSIAILATYFSNLSAAYTISQGTNSTTYSSAGLGTTTAWTGQKIFAMPMATMLSEGGEYYFMMQNSTAGTGQVMRMSHIVLNNMTNGSFGKLAPSGITASNNTIIPNYNGFIYTVTSASPPTSFALTERRIQSNIRMYIQLDA